jgi:8-oxo-dGTP pyrophosphatase MutT (NUDIX family)
MELIIYDSNLTVKDVQDNPIQTACRGLVEQAGKVLVVHETKRDITTLPGGRLEPDETPEACVIREILEETGVTVGQVVETVRIVEHFQDASFRTIYFRCEVVDLDGEASHTSVEHEMGMVAQWMDLEDLMDRLANPSSSHPHSEHIHNREFLGLIHSR